MYKQNLITRYCANQWIARIKFTSRLFTPIVPRERIKAGEGTHLCFRSNGPYIFTKRRIL